MHHAWRSFNGNEGASVLILGYWRTETVQDAFSSWLLYTYSIISGVFRVLRCLFDVEQESISYRAQIKSTISCDLTFYIYRKFGNQQVRYDGYQCDDGPRSCMWVFRSRKGI